MFWQLDKDNGLLTGYLAEDPSERRDRTGKRMIVLDVCYDAERIPYADGHRHNTIRRMPVVVFGEYTSYARTLVKGDCVIAIGERPLKPPRGYTTNPMMVGKKSFGFIGGTGITRAWKSELDQYRENEIVQEIKGKKRNNKKQIKESADKFDEITGDEW